jgi:hypothetical protein
MMASIGRRRTTATARRTAATLTWKLCTIAGHYKQKKPSTCHHNTLFEKCDF